MADKVPSETVKHLQELANEVELLRSELAAKGAQLDLEVARAVSSLGHGITTALICLSCGTIRMKGEQECSSCRGSG